MSECVWATCMNAYTLFLVTIAPPVAQAGLNSSPATWSRCSCENTKTWWFLTVVADDPLTDPVWFCFPPLPWLTSSTGNSAVSLARLGFGFCHWFFSHHIFLYSVKILKYKYIYIYIESSSTVSASVTSLTAFSTPALTHWATAKSLMLSKQFAPCFNHWENWVAPSLSLL